MRHMPALIPSLALALALSLTAAPAFAAFDGPGSAQTAAMAPLTKAAQVAKAADDTPCLLEGKLVERTAGRKNLYTFKDDSGTITVKIGAKQFRNRSVSPENTVRLSGEVDTKRDRPTQVDVDWIEVIK